MSPEGLIYNCYGEKTDIWAFGIIIYELLHGETPFCHCPTEVDLKNSVLKPLAENRFKKGINPLLRQLMNSLLEVSESKRPSVYELANDPYIKGLLMGQVQQPAILLKKRPFETPLITLNQSYSQQQQNIASDVNSYPKTVPVFRPNSLQSPRRANKTEQAAYFPAKLEAPKKEDRKISFQGKPEAKNMELGGGKNVPTVKFGLRVPSEQPRPSSTREEQRGKITVTYCEHPHLASTVGALRQREFSEKTIETK
jgi:serine/threonine protein kinase